MNTNKDTLNICNANVIEIISRLHRLGDGCDNKSLKIRIEYIVDKLLEWQNNMNELREFF